MSFNRQLKYSVDQVLCRITRTSLEQRFHVLHVLASIHGIHIDRSQQACIELQRHLALLNRRAHIGRVHGRRQKIVQGSHA